MSRLINFCDFVILCYFDSRPSPGTRLRRVPMASQWPAGKSVVVQDIYSKGGGRRIQGRSRSRSPGNKRGTPPAFPIDPFVLRLLRLPRPEEVHTFRLDAEDDYVEHPVFAGVPFEPQFQSVEVLYNYYNPSLTALYSPFNLQPYRVCVVG